jgi:hypothetical protein
LCRSDVDLVNALQIRRQPRIKDLCRTASDRYRNLSTAPFNSTVAPRAPVEAGGLVGPRPMAYKSTGAEPTVAMGWKFASNARTGPVAEAVVTTTGTVAFDCP